jgi:hypothetical protein
MVSGLAFLATAIATLFWEAMLVRYTRRRRPHEGVWTVALAMFAGATTALAVGASTGWDAPTFRVFYLLGAILNVPWLALGTVYLLASPRVARSARSVLLVFSGLATGAVFSTPIDGVVPRTEIPSGHELFGAFPRVLAAVGSGLGAVVILVGALWSMRVALRSDRAGTALDLAGGAPAGAPAGAGHRHDGESSPGRIAASNAAIAVGTLVLSSGGLWQGIVGHDEAFSLSLVVGIAVIHLGFVISTRRAPAPRTARPLTPVGT